MPTPIDFTKVEIGFGQETSKTNFTRGWPGLRDFAVALSKFVPVATGEEDILDGMFVYLNTAGEAVKLTTGAVSPTMPQPNFVADPYEFNTDNIQGSRKITILTDNLQATTGLFDATEEFSTFQADDHPIAEEVVIVGTNAGTTYDYTTQVLTINGTDFEALGLRVGDTFTVTSPSLWNDDRDNGTTPTVASTQADQIRTITVIAGSSITHDGVALNDPGGNLYDGTPDSVEFGGAGVSNPPGDYHNGTIVFNRAVADFRPGVGISSVDGKVIINPSGDQIVGYVLDTDPLHRTITFELKTYRGV